MQNRKKPLLINRRYNVYVYEICSKELPCYGWQKITLYSGYSVLLPKDVLEILFATLISVNKIFPYYEISDARFLQLPAPHVEQWSENKNPNVMVTWQQADRRFLGSTIVFAYEKSRIV